MVLFKNIVFDENWIEADAEVNTATAPDYFHVKIGREESMDKIEYYPQTGDTYHLQMACWNLQMDVNAGKVKQHSIKCIAWG